MYHSAVSIGFLKYKIRIGVLATTHAGYRMSVVNGMQKDHDQTRTEARRKHSGETDK